MAQNVYPIDGLYNDDKTYFESYLVCEDQTIDNDDNVFFYGMSRSKAIQNIGVPGTDFTITKVHK